MEIQTESFSIESHSRFEILSVTPEVEATIEDLGVTDGLVYVSTPHTSAALSTNEYEEKLLDDMIDKFKEIAPRTTATTTTSTTSPRASSRTPTRTSSPR